MEEFCERGYLPDAMVNFLALWAGRWTASDAHRPQNPMRRFSLDRVTKGRRVRRDELDWMNSQYIRRWERTPGCGIENMACRGRVVGKTGVANRRGSQRIASRRTRLPPLALPDDSFIRRPGRHRRSNRMVRRLYPLLAERETPNRCRRKTALYVLGPQVRELDGRASTRC
ncbi:MAG: hypothetical protein ACLSVD_11410 [Eggerthellaceae bacterium]